MHQGSCECDAGEFAGDKIHEWLCPWLACLLGECSCDSSERPELRLPSPDSDD